MIKTEKTKPDPMVRRYLDSLIQARKDKERAQFEKQRPIVCDNTQLYETCLTFLASAVERKDEERARYWSRTAFQYAPPKTK